MVVCFFGKDCMEGLPEVETAKALMTEAAVWSVMKWLREKKRVRKTADQANAALDQLAATIRQSWSDDLRGAYDALVQSGASAARGVRKTDLAASDHASIAKKLKDADDEAYRARMDAEGTFDAAEKQLSTSLAREGCRKAIHAWELKEKAIRKSESAIPSK